MVQLNNPMKDCPMQPTASGTHEALPDDRNAAVLIYINGELVPRAQAAISVFDSGYLVGDGIWEGIRLHDGVFAFLDRHLDRLFDAARVTRINIGLSREEIAAILHRTVEANSMHTGVHVRLMITRGNKKTPSQDPRLTVSPPNIVVIAEHKLANPEVRSEGIRLFTASVRRQPPNTLDPRLNCHSKLHEVIALSEAIEAGFDEALMLDVRGFVSTCNATNFFIVRAGQVWTSTGEYCLNGVTRGLVIELCREHGIPVFAKDFPLEAAHSACEAFVTGTFGGITPVRGIGGHAMSAGVPGPLTARLTALYEARIHAECQRAGDRPQ
jgi:branched-chain amino acid aminotransferase